MIEKNIKERMAQYIREGNRTTVLDLLEGELEYLDDAELDQSVISEVIEVLDSDISVDKKIAKVWILYDGSLAFRNMGDSKPPYP